MAKKTKSSSSTASQNKVVMVIVLLAIGFIGGFLVARMRYKPQINTLFNMVMEKDNETSDLKTEVNLYKAKMMMNDKGAMEQ